MNQVNVFNNARVMYQEAIKNRANSHKEIITKIRLEIMKAVDEGNTEFNWYGHIPIEVVDLLKESNYKVSVDSYRNETMYTIKFK